MQMWTLELEAFQHMGNQSWGWPDTRHPSVVPHKQHKNFFCTRLPEQQKQIYQYRFNLNIYSLMQHQRNHTGGFLLTGGRVYLCVCAVLVGLPAAASTQHLSALIVPLLVPQTAPDGWEVSLCAAPLATQFGVVYMTCSKLMDKSFAGVILSNKPCKYVFLQRPCLIGLWFCSPNNNSLKALTSTLELWKVLTHERRSCSFVFIVLLFTGSL